MKRALSGILALLLAAATMSCGDTTESVDNNVNTTMSDAIDPDTGE